MKSHRFGLKPIKTAPTTMPSAPRLLLTVAAKASASRRRRVPGLVGSQPGSALLGAALVLAADVVARTIVKPAELPLGVLTAFIGVPLFLAMLRQFRSKV